MRDYSAAIKCLNSLQTNAAILEAIRSTGNLINQLSMPEMKRYLERIGLYSSPHILEVRERIRINGSPISKESFAKYFFNVWDRLEETVPPVIDIHNPDKPSYFRYLTLVAFHAFLQEKVDTVILEVGVGGEYDATNVVESPVVCGITPLGMDHVASLGDTIEKIAWHKAGIIKENSPVFTVNQPGDAIKIIQARATERKASKCQIITPEQLEKISSIKLGLSGEHQKINAALAVALCEEWIKI
ncbi:Folylpolyglutamate synthetase, partial [Globomyces sp. JEL0801]